MIDAPVAQVVLIVVSCRGAEADSRGPYCCRTKVIPQFFFDKVCDAPVMQFLQVSQVVAIPVATQRLIPTVSLTIETPVAPG